MCSSFISATMIKYPDYKQRRGRRVCSYLAFQVAVCYCREVEAGFKQLVISHPQSKTEGNKCTPTTCLLFSAFTSVTQLSDQPMTCTAKLKMGLSTSINNQDSPPQIFPQFNLTWVIPPLTVGSQLDLSCIKLTTRLDCIQLALKAN